MDSTPSPSYALLSTLYPSDSKAADAKSVDTAFTSLKTSASKTNSKELADREEAERAIEILINIAASAKSEPLPIAGTSGPKTLAERAVEVLGELRDSKTQQVPARTKTAVEQQVARLKALVESARQPKAPKSSDADSKHVKSIHDSFVKDLHVPLAIQSPVSRGLADKRAAPLDNPSSPKDSKCEVHADENEPVSDDDDAVEFEGMTVVGKEPLSLAAVPSDQQARELQARVKSLVAKSFSPEAGSKPSVMRLNIEGQDKKPLRSIAVVAVSSPDAKGAESSRTRTDFAVLTYGVPDGWRDFHNVLGAMLKLESKTPDATIAHLQVERPAADSAEFHADVCDAMGALHRELGEPTPTVKRIKEILERHFASTRKDVAAPADPPVVSAPSSSFSSSIPAPVSTGKPRS